MAQNQWWDNEAEFVAAHGLTAIAEPPMIGRVTLCPSAYHHDGSPGVVLIASYASGFKRSSKLHATVAEAYAAWKKTVAAWLAA